MSTPHASFVQSVETDGAGAEPTSRFCAIDGFAEAERASKGTRILPGVTRPKCAAAADNNNADNTVPLGTGTSKRPRAD